MKNIFFLIAVGASFNVFGQHLTSNNKQVEQAFQLAVQTVDLNTRSGILAAGADYGGEWTRDISINSWNGASILRPVVAEQSLWSVTINKDTIGHQYWDKIIWVIAANNYYKVTGDKTFLKKAYQCSVNSMEQLEGMAFDKKYNLFTGPSVFNDGIAGYPEPIFEPGNKSSFVLDHKGAASIKCLSTNAVYYGAYLALIEMGRALGERQNLNGYPAKAAKLKQGILQYLYNTKQHRFNYLVDQNGKIDPSQEGLGISFAVMFGIVKGSEATRVIKNAVVSKYGITSIYPDFERYSADTPGRHNNLVWPMVNGFFAQAALQSNNYSSFSKELQNLGALALDAGKGNHDFKEIYNPNSGKPDGGWQADGSVFDHHWASCKSQTWSATAYISMVLDGLMGLSFNERSLSIEPYLPAGINHVSFDKLAYRDAILNIDVKGKGKKIKTFKMDGKIQLTHSISSSLTGNHQVNIEVE
jgi:glycogen debranching enzyme